MSRSTQTESYERGGGNLANNVQSSASISVSWAVMHWHFIWSYICTIAIYCYLSGWVSSMLASAFQLPFCDSPHFWYLVI